MAITHTPTVRQRFCRARTRPSAAMVSGESTSPSRTMTSSCSSTRIEREAMAGRPLMALPSSPAPAIAPWMRPIGPRLRSIHWRTTGSATVQMSSLGSKLRATPSTTTMVFCNRISSGRVCMSNNAVTSSSSDSSFAMEISSAMRLWIGSPMARMACAKFSTEWCDGT